MKARRYCDGGGCVHRAAWIASYTTNLGEKRTMASCGPCLPALRREQLVGIQEDQPLNWQAFVQENTPTLAAAGMRPVPLDNYGSESILDEAGHEDEHRV